MISQEAVQKVLVLAGELSYLEQAPQTNRLVSVFLDIYRHCTSERTTVPLYSEMKAASQFISMLQDLLPVYRNLSVAFSDEFRQIEVPPGSAINFINESADKGEMLNPQFCGQLSWHQGRYIWKTGDTL